MQRLAQNWRRHGVTVALVPTMGYLHRGHLSLIKQARQAVGKNGKVVVSIYVNPTQFGPTEDLSRYPRDLRRDLRLCRGERVDAVFTPSDKDMYPGGFSTFVVEEELSSVMEGASRPTHFRGVTTIVAKLFNIVQPTVAAFGAKDYQQAAVIKQMVRDLNFPVRIIVAPTVREPDGLALSSRNKYLKGDQRRSALILSRTMKEIQRLARQRPVVAHRAKQLAKSRINKTPQARLDYIEFFHPETLQPVASVKPGTHMALAVFVGRTRLIDNARV
jgi:pantoate--beta-alanine ligase